MENEATIGAVIVGSLILGLISVGLANWAVGFWKLWNRQPLVAWEPRQSPPWGLFDLIVAVVLVLGGTIVAAQVMQAAGWLPKNLVLADATPQQTALLILADGASRLAVMPLLFLLIAVRTGASARDLGFVPGKLLSDIRLGVVAFTMLLPLVYVIQAILTRYQKYEHELINVLAELPGWQWAVAMTFVAGVSAPIAEEILFRLLLQGWIEKLFGFRGPTHELVLGAMRGRHVSPELPAETTVAVLDAQPPVWAQSAEPLSVDKNPYATPAAFVGESQYGAEAPSILDHSTGTIPWALRYFGWIAIGITSLIFALLHWSHGPAWVALTVLAAGMGYLYQRTHRIVPSLVVHGLLNNLTMLIVLLNPEAKA